MSKKVKISVGIDSKGAESGSKKVNAALRKTERRAEATGASVGRLNRTMGGFASMAKKAGAAIIAYFSVKTIVSFSKSAISEFQTLETAMWRIEKQARVMGKAWATTDYITKFSREIGRATLGSATEVRQATQLLLTQQGLTQDSYEETIRVAQSLSEVTGKSMLTAARYFARAMSDTSGAMSMFQRDGMVFNEQLKEQIKSLQEAGDMAGAYNILLVEMSKRLPDASKGGTTLAHSFDSAGEATQQLKENIGENLAPAVKLLVDDYTSWINVNGALIAQDFPEYIESTAIALTYVLDAGQGIGRVFNLAGKAVALFALDAEVRVLGVADAVINGPIEALNDLIDLYNRIPALPDINPFESDLGQTIKDELVLTKAAIEAGVEDINYAAGEVSLGHKIRESMEDAQAAIEEGLGEVDFPTEFEDGFKSLDAAASKTIKTLTPLPDLIEKTGKTPIFNITASDASDAQGYIDSTRTALEEYAAEIENLVDLQSKGAFADAPETYARAVQAAYDKMIDATKDTGDEIKSDYEKWWAGLSETTQDAVKEIQQIKIGRAHV